MQVIQQCNPLWIASNINVNADKEFIFSNYVIEPLVTGVIKKEYPEYDEMDIVHTTEYEKLAGWNIRGFDIIWKTKNGDIITIDVKFSSPYYANTKNISFKPTFGDKQEPTYIGTIHTFSNTKKPCVVLIPYEVAMENCKKCSGYYLLDVEDTCKKGNGILIYELKGRQLDFYNDMLTIYKAAGSVKSGKELLRRLTPVFEKYNINKPGMNTYDFGL